MLPQVIILIPLLLFVIIYAYYRIFRILRAKCPNCLQRPKLGVGRWLWEIWKIGAMPWKKISFLCGRCRKKIKFCGGKFVKAQKEF